MSDPFLDTNVFIRYLTGDDPQKQEEATALFEQVEQRMLRVVVLEAVIAEAVYVLGSPQTYHIPRAQVSAMLISLVQLPHFHIYNREIILRALEIYGATNIDFTDAMIIASMRAAGATELYSYDAAFNRFPDIVRNPDLLT